MLFTVTHPFTKESAAEAGRKSWANRVKREEEGRLAVEALRNMPLTSSDVRALRIATQMERIEKMIERQTDADVIHKLATSHAALFKTWQVLTGTPNPGVRKPGRQRPVIQMAEPIQETPAPSQSQEPNG